MKDQKQMKKKLVPITLYTAMGRSPGILDFVCNKYIVKEPFTLNFKDDTEKYPLARELFKFDYVKRVSFDQNIISITKGKEVEWYEVSTELRDFLRHYLMHQKPVVA